MIDFSNKKVVVTGGSRGIGKSIVNEFAKYGANLVIASRNKPLDFKELPNCKFYQVDFSDNLSVKEFSNYLQKEKVDVLVNNAGINKIDLVEDIKVEDFNNILNVNLVAPYILINSVIKNMKTIKGGKIINIGSIWSKISKEKRSSYSASKFGLHGITSAVAAEAAKYNVLVNTVSPGFVNTELTKKILGESGINEQKSMVPINRLAEPEEIAKYVVWLCSDENTYISGQNLIIDGGFTNV